MPDQDPPQQLSPEVMGLVGSLASGLTAQAMSVASVPATWRVIHFALVKDEVEKAPEAVTDPALQPLLSPSVKKKAKPSYPDGLPVPLDFGALHRGEKRWAPEFRQGSNRFVFLKELYDLYHADQTARKTDRQRVSNAALVLLRNLTGDSLLALRKKVFAQGPREFERRAPWWSATPVPPMDAKQLGIAHDANRNISERVNLGAIAQSLMAFYRPEVTRALDEFAVFDGEKEAAQRANAKTVAAAEDVEESDSEALEDRQASIQLSPEYAPFFRITGVLRLREETKYLISKSLRPRVAQSFMEMPWTLQFNPEAVVEFFLRRLPQTVLNASHYLLAEMQRDLIGELVVAGYPLAVLPEQDCGDSLPSTNLPRGRRQAFKVGEVLALKRELERIARPSIIRSLAPDCKNPAAVIAGAAAQAGELGFLHLSGIYLTAWVERAKAQAAKSDSATLAFGRVPKPDDTARFDALLKRYTEMMNMILVRNYGLACYITVRTFRRLPYLAKAHRSNDVSSLVKGFLSKCIQTFNPNLKNRFSTFAQNTIELDLKRATVAEGSVLSLSDDDKSNLPEVNSLAKSSNLDREDPNFCDDLAARFNAKKGLRGRAQMTAERAQSLLAVGNLVTVGPVEEDGETREFQLSSNLHPSSAASSALDPGKLAEVTEVVESVLKTKFTSGQEFDLSLLHRASQRPKAMKRLNDHIMEKTLADGLKAIGRASAKTRGKVALAPGELGLRNIRTTAADEQARNLARGKDPEGIGM